MDGRTLWTKLLPLLTWPNVGRVIAALVLADQWIGPLGGIPSSEAIVVVCLGAIFAPVPSPRKKEKDE